MKNPGKNTKLLFLVTEDKWFLTHRLPLARAAREEGYDVVVVTRITKYREAIEAEGFRVVPLRISRGGVNPLDELRTINDLLGIYRRESPDICHHIGIKYILYGTFSANRAHVRHVVNAFAGLGFIYSSDHWKARLIRPLLNIGLRMFHNRQGVRVIFQNPDDMRLLLETRVVGEDKAVLIRSSGVDLDRFQPMPEPSDVVRVVMAGRLLWAKGVGVLAEAGKILRERGVDVCLRLVGEPDSQNPSSVSEAQLGAWQSERLLEWTGYSEHMPQVWAESSIGVLPTSYGEGVPKVLLEAAACGRPLIATDAPGCREIVQHGENGLLVPVKDPIALADAIQALVENPDLRKLMGEKSRRLVEDCFSDKQVAAETVEVYRQLLEEYQ